jgi:hypothetical protein
MAEEPHREYPDTKVQGLTERVARITRSRLATATRRIVRLAKSSASATQRIATLARSTGREVVHFARTSPIPRTFLVSYLLFALFALLLLSSLFLLTRVRLESFELGYRIVQLEQERDRLKARTRSLEAQRTRLSTSAHLLQMNQSMGLYLLPPEKWIQNDGK